MRDAAGGVERWWGQRWPGGLPGWFCLRAAQDPPLSVVGQAEPVGLVWQQVEQCHGSCCRAGLPSALKGPCARAGLSSVGPRPGERGEPQGFSPAGLSGAPPAALRAGRWLRALHTPGWDIPEVSCAVVRTWADLWIPCPVFAQGQPILPSPFHECCYASEPTHTPGQARSARHSVTQAGRWLRQDQADGSRMAGALGQARPGRAVPGFCPRRAVAAARGRAWTPGSCPRRFLSPCPSYRFWLAVPRLSASPPVALSRGLCGSCRFLVL